MVLNKLDDCRIVAMQEGWRIERQKRGGKTVTLLSFSYSKSNFSFTIFLTVGHCFDNHM